MKRFEIHPRAGKIQPRDNLQPLGLIVRSLFFEKFTLILGCLFAAGSRTGLLRLLTGGTNRVSVDQQTRPFLARFILKRKVVCETPRLLCGIIYRGVFIVL